MHSQRLYLRTLERDDLKQLGPFFKDPEQVKYYIPTLWRSYSEEQLTGLLEDWHDQPAYVVYVITEKETGDIIGLANLDGINLINGNSEMGIAITRTDKQGQGFAKEALSILINYCFDEMRLHRVYARIIEANEGSVALFKRLGFKEEGRMREHVHRSGKFLDMLFFGLLKEEWQDKSSPSL